jgi:hypothetical protein
VAAIAVTAKEVAAHGGGFGHRSGGGGWCYYHPYSHRCRG